MPTYNKNIPASTDQYSSDQPLIQGNFEYLDAIASGLNNGGTNAGFNYALFNDTSAPTTAANTMAIYAKDIAGVSQLFIRRESSGSELNVTLASLADPGYTYLPSGILMQWGSQAMSGTSAQTINITFPVAFATACLNVQITTQQGTAGSDANGFIRLVSYNTTGAVGYASSRTTAAGSVSAACTARWLAIGY